MTEATPSGMSARGYGVDWLLALGLVGFLALASRFWAVQQGVIENGMSLPLAKHVLQCHGARQANAGVPFVRLAFPHQSDSSIWTLPDGAAILLGGSGPSETELSIYHITVYPSGVNMKFPNGQDRRVSTLDLSDHARIVRWHWVRLVWFAGCMGVGVYLWLRRSRRVLGVIVLFLGVSAYLLKIEIPGVYAMGVPLDIIALVILLVLVLLGVAIDSEILAGKSQAAKT